MPTTYAATNTKKFLDADGLTYFSRKLNNYPTNDVIAAVINGTQDALDEKLNANKVGAANGVASLGSDGKVPSSQLPSNSNTTYSLSQDASNGHIITLTPSSGSAQTITIPDNNTWNPLTTSQPGYVATKLPNNDSKFLDGKGNWTVPSYPVSSVAGKTGVVTLASSDVGLGNVDNTSDLNKPISTLTQTALNGKLDSSLKGAVNGVAELDANGKIPSSQLPSYVDDVLEYSQRDNFPLTGESGKIYVDLNTDTTWRWSGSAYVQIKGDLSLGESSADAYRGDRGKAAYDHAQAKGSAYTSGLYKITTNSEGHVTSATEVVKADITALGIPASNTNTHRPIKVNSTQTLGDNTTALNLINGSNISITSNSGDVTISATYSNATTSADGLMSAADKTKLNGIATGATANTGTVTSVATGVGLTGGSITTTGTIKANLTSETKLTNAASDGTETAGRVYPVRVDKNNKLAVNVPWINTTYDAITNAQIDALFA